MRRGLLAGILGWAVLTAIMWVWDDLLLPDTAFAFLRAFLMTGPLAAAAAVILRLAVCPREAPERFVIGFTIPGLLLATATMFAFGDLFPDATPFTRGHYGILMLWGYGIILAVFALLFERPKP